MIEVEFFGGAKKSFPSGTATLDCAGATISRMLEILAESKPPGTPALDARNVLVAVNGADSSSLGGPSATLRDGDRVAIIPVIHGGRPVRFRVLDTDAAAVCVPSADLDALRRDFPDLRMQAVSADFVLGATHLRRILEISLESCRRNTMLARSVEADILLRLAGTTQIARAIRTAGAVPGRAAVVVALGGASRLLELEDALAGVAEPFPEGNDGFLGGLFDGPALSTGHTLEDLLVERASVL